MSNTPSTSNKVIQL